MSNVYDQNLALMIVNELKRTNPDLETLRYLAVYLDYEEPTHKDRIVFKRHVNTYVELMDCDLGLEKIEFLQQILKDRMIAMYNESICYEVSNN